MFPYDDQDPDDTTGYTVDEYVKKLDREFGLVVCGFNDPARICIIWSPGGSHKSVGHIQVKYNGNWESKISTEIEHNISCKPRKQRYSPTSSEGLDSTPQPFVPSNATMALFGTARTPAIPEWITNAVVHTSAVLGPINQNLVSTSISDTSIGAATERPISVPLTNLVVMCSAASECSNSEKGYNCK
ncbi:unnamed protein product [Aspergillus oryzae]|uniref:Unnamed protein product n=2 Tax=Aspergillus oryzae TaxID=5062 RepID=A0AAN4YIN3_ASPOZ|nr:unnamed protein product [Aspergillus oryzae]GMF91000.1 unnamed protein product [Aspergillus oryzae]GMG12642.1 unnamed protein product [Aspergillus oryzae]GMG27625.1 unnamed protein product [Aspergillus oryzae]GMG43185.1 unnamed protein product [Aspergillus oryzae var. brunneus]